MIENIKSETDLSGFYVVYKGSVLNEDSSTYGISHLIEHLLIKQFKDLYDDFDRYSIYWNAYTSPTEIVCYITGLDEYLYKYRHEYLNSFLKFNITEEEFNTEKNVVIQEYLDMFQDQSATTYLNLLRENFHYYSAIGKLESLEKLTYEDLKSFYKKYYTKPSKIINVSKHNKFTGYNDFKTTYPKKINIDKSDVLKLEDDMKFNKASVMGYMSLSEDISYIKFVLTMLSTFMNSPFTNEIRVKRGLTYGVATTLDALSENDFICLTQVITSKKNVNEVLKTYKMILETDDYITKELFNITKEFFIIERKKDDINRYENIEKYIIPTHLQIDNILNDLTYEKTKEVFNKHLKYDKWLWKTDK